MTFPVTGLRDDFNRVGPGIGANWSRVGNPTTIGYFGIVSDQANPGSISSCAIFLPDGVRVDQEALVTFNNVPSWGAGNWGGVALRVRNIDFSFTNTVYDCYRLRCTPATPDILVERVVANTGTLMLTITGANATFATGDGFGASIYGGTISVYRRTGAGAWTKIGEVTDPSPHPDGYHGMVGRGVNTFLDNFGGGFVSAPTVSFDDVTVR